MRSKLPLSPSIFMDWRGTWRTNPSARILSWRRTSCAFCRKRSRRCGIRDPRRFDFTPSEAHVGTAALGCPAGRSPVRSECWDERKSWRAALARTAEGGCPHVVRTSELARNVIVELWKELRPKLHHARLGGIGRLAVKHWGHQAHQATVAAIHANRIGHEIVFGLVLAGHLAAMRLKPVQHQLPLSRF